jgi:glycosyltransferase involved in cell wall biosynthesis
VRVLLVTAYFAPHVGGVERFSEILAAGLAARGHEVTVLTTRTDAASALREERDRYRVERVPATNAVETRLGVPYPLPSPRAVARALRRLVPAADVVHVQDALYATSAAALLGARRRGVPSLLTAHVGFVPQRNRILDGVERVALRAAGRWARAAGRVVSYNPEVAAWAERAWRLERVDVLPVGVAPPAEGDRAEFGLAEDAFVAVFVGRDVPKKRLDVVAGAADPAYELVAVTDRQRPPAAGFRTLRLMAPDRVARLLGVADAFVLPSEAEGIPLALQEAMTAGLPVVTTFAPGYARYFSTEDVLAVEPTARSVREALRRLAADPALAARLAERSRAVAAEHFSADAFVTAYERAYERLTA